jgi:hypothetical protein
MSQNGIDGVYGVWFNLKDLVWSRNNDSLIKTTRIAGRKYLEH